jgi:hypothetical protein
MNAILADPDSQARFAVLGASSTGDGGHTLKKPKLGILLARQIQIHSLLSVSAQAGRPSFSCNGACPPYVRNDSINRAWP